MSLLTRQNPETDELEVLVNNEWQPFTAYREKQIADAYEKSVKFLRERLGEDAAEKEQELLTRNQEHVE
ncbi:MAG: hypothetical protein U0Y68_21570 [Blastocatellia bacterium]